MTIDKLRLRAAVDAAVAATSAAAPSKKAYTRSIASDTPWPTPTQRVARP